MDKTQELTVQVEVLTDLVGRLIAQYATDRGIELLEMEVGFMAQFRSPQSAAEPAWLSQVRTEVAEVAEATIQQVMSVARTFPGIARQPGGTLRPSS